MTAVDMRMTMPSTWLEPFRQLNPGLRTQLIGAVALLASTGAIAVAVPVGLLAGAGGHPMAQVWIIAVIVCVYAFLFLLCIWLSWPFYTDLSHLSYGLLLAAAAAHVGPRAAVIALHLATLYAAAHLGYALALHRLRTGAQQGVELPAPHPDPEKDAREMALMVLAVTAFWTVVMAVFVHVIDCRDGSSIVINELWTSLDLSLSGCFMHVLGWMCQGGQPQWMSEFLVLCVSLCPVVPQVAASWIVAASFQWLLLLGLTASLAYRAAVNLHPCPPPPPAAATDEIIDHHHGGDVGER